MEDQQVHARGRLTEMESGFAQRYGTRWGLLDEGQAEVSYALKSDTHDLDGYVGQLVEVSGFLVEGFPVEAGGPGYISVVELSEP